MEFNLLNFALVMLLAGAGSFGGGIGAVNIIKDCALNWNWILDEQEFLKAASFAQYGGYGQGITISVYLGGKLGVLGVITGVLAFILPSVLFVAVILKIGGKLYKNGVFKYSVKYINILAAGLICVIFWNYALTIFSVDPIIYIAVAGLACFFNIRYNINPVILLLAGAVIGLVWRA